MIKAETLCPDSSLVHVRTLTVKQVAELLGLHPRSVWRMSADGTLPKPIRIGTKAVRWRFSDLADFIQGSKSL